MFGIIEECSPEDIHLKEIYWIEYFNSIEEGYNEALPNGKDDGRIWSDKEKEAQSARLKSIWRNLPEEARAKRIEKIKNSRPSNMGELIKNKKANIRMYDKTTQQLKHEFNTYDSASEFLNIDSKRLKKVCSKIISSHEKIWVYKNFIILRGDYTLEDWEHRKHIYKMNVKLKHHKNLKPQIVKPKLTQEERSASQRQRALKSVEKLRQSGKYRVEVIHRDSGELVKVFPLLSDACKYLGFNKKRIGDVFSKGRNYYKGYIFNRLY